jgi:hypothetical protein
MINYVTEFSMDDGKTWQEYSRRGLRTDVVPQTKEDLAAIHQAAVADMGRARHDWPGAEAVRIRKIILPG